MRKSAPATHFLPLTGRYASMHILNSDNLLNVAEISVFAANACPIRSATGATAMGGSMCSGAGWGQVCTHVCRQELDIGDAIVVEIMDPSKVLGLVQMPEVAEVGADVRERLVRVVAAVAAASPSSHA